MDYVALITDKDLAFKILESRQKYERLFLFYNCNQYFIFRPLLVSEYETITSLDSIIDENILDEWVVSKTIISNNLEFLLGDAPAGYVSSYANGILSKSMPNSLKNLSNDIEKARESRSTTPIVIDFMLKAGAGQILKNTKDITYRQQIDYLVYAEDILGKQIELASPKKPNSKNPNKPISAKTMAIISKKSADKPDFENDNKAIMGI